MLAGRRRRRWPSFSFRDGSYVLLRRPRRGRLTEARFTSRFTGYKYMLHYYTVGELQVQYQVSPRSRPAPPCVFEQYSYKVSHSEYSILYGVHVKLYCVKLYARSQLEEGSRSYYTCRWAAFDQSYREVPQSHIVIMSTWYQC